MNTLYNLFVWLVNAIKRLFVRSCNHTIYHIGCPACSIKAQERIEREYDELMVKWSDLPKEDQDRIQAEQEAHAIDYCAMYTDVSGEPTPQWILDAWDGEPELKPRKRRLISLDEERQLEAWSGSL